MQWIGWLILIPLSLTRAHAGDLPDPKLTPGAVTDLTVEQICARKWGRDRRHVTQEMKREVRDKYPGTKCHRDRSGRLIEIDHLISRELGGADVTANLWPECYAGQWNASMKDRLENRLHREVCAGRMTLEQARTEIATDWRAAYRRFFMETKK